MKNILFIFATCVVGNIAYAQDITLGTPGYGGTGCPAGSASVTLSPDARSLSILFDAFTVSATRGQTFERKSCNIAVPVRVPQGLSVAILQVDYRGCTWAHVLQNFSGPIG